MTLYETIFKRRAVRKFELHTLGLDETRELNEYIAGLRQLDGCCARLEMVSKESAGNNKAPHYVLCFCPKTPEEYINAGYLLDKIDLYIQSHGLGALYLGMAKPLGREEISDFAIMLAFGPTETPLRDGTGFDRLPVNDISNEDNNIAQAARLAPSAMNSQPWKLEFNEGTVDIRYKGRGLLKGLLKKKLSKIDLGIIAAHTEIALAEQGKTIRSVKPFSDDKSFRVEIQYE